MVTIVNPAERGPQAAFLKAHLKLMKLGMKNSQTTSTQMLAKASALTGNTYKRGQYDAAIADLQAIVNEAMEPPKG